MENNKYTTFVATVDYINMLSPYSTIDAHLKLFIQIRIDAYNSRHGLEPGFTHVDVEFEIDNEMVTRKQIETEIESRVRSITGIRPFKDEIEGECATSTVEIKDTNICIEMNGVGEAKIMSECSDPGIIYRAFKEEDEGDYEDYELGKLVKEGNFCLD